MIQNSQDTEQDCRVARTHSGSSVEAELGLGDAATKSGCTLVSSSADGGHPQGRAWPTTATRASLRREVDGQQSSNTENQYTEKLR